MGGLPTSGVNIQEKPGCDDINSPDGHVTVRYTEQHELFFAPILGLGNSGTITTAATAEWVPGGASNPVPFVIQVTSFQSGNCEVPNVPAGTICHFAEDNGGGGSGGFGGSSFGMIDINPDAWGNIDPADCKNPKMGDLETAADGGYTGPPPLPPLNYPDPTWACAPTGLKTPVFDILEGHVGEILAFPVVDTDPYIQGSHVTAWNVLGFVKMKLLKVIRPKSATGGSLGSCSVTVPQASATAGSVFTFHLQAASGCPNSPNALDSVTNVQVQGCGVREGTPCALGSDYTLIPGTGVPQQVQLMKDMPNRVDISFDWEYFDECGQSAGNNSGYCLVMEWEGVQLGNAPGGGSYGIVHVRLCDEAITDSCQSG